MARRADRRRFGQVTTMRSGRWQARYTVPLAHESGRGGHIVTAPHTFEPGAYGKQAAEDWLRSEDLRLQSEGADWRTLVEHAETERLRAEAERVVTFGEYAETWLRARKVKGGRPLQDSTRRGFAGLRFGELVALRRSDVDLKSAPPVLHIRRAIGTGPGGKRYEKEPKSRAGIRDQRIPASVARVLAEHLSTYVTGRDGLVFPGPSGGWLQPTRFRDLSGGWRDVRVAVGRPINFHDLRATGATRLAQRGAHVAEVQAFLGDSSSQAAERYVRATQSRMDDLTALTFDGLDFGGVTR